MRVAAIWKGTMAATWKDTQDWTEGPTSVVVLMGDREFLPYDDEVRVADLYTCGVHTDDA